MCGIFAYITSGKPLSRKVIIDILLRGLRRLEYRGYDSAGLCVDGADGRAAIVKAVGNVSKLEERIYQDVAVYSDDIVDNHVGIAHTRWATHGEPSDVNAHPHASDADAQFVVVHNGIVTNYLELRALLARHGVACVSETDTELIARLALYIYSQQPTLSFPQLVVATTAMLEGAYALVFRSSHFPGEAVACRRGSPLIVGVSAAEVRADAAAAHAEVIIASDPAAIVEHTRSVCYLDDGDVIHVMRGGRVARVDAAAPAADSAALRELPLILEQVGLELAEIAKGPHAHFMLKEIVEQPDALRATMRGRVRYDAAGVGCVTLGGIRPHVEAAILRARRLVFVACGTSHHVALACRQVVESLSRIPVSVEVASDFLDRTPVVCRDDVFVFVSQSGETADTLAALSYVLERGAFTVGFTNVVGSSISRRTHCGCHVNAGMEIGVASTKAYTCQIVAVLLFALLLAADRVSASAECAAIFRALRELPDAVAAFLPAADAAARAHAKALAGQSALLVLGRGAEFATALEGALKVKEVAYIMCQGIAAGELKHGPLALVDSSMATVAVAPRDPTLPKMRSAVEQVCARGGRPTVLCAAEDAAAFLAIGAGAVVEVPTMSHVAVQPVVSVVYFQLLAYYLAVERGYNVDQPRNLAKSVTVE